MEEINLGNGVSPKGKGKSLEQISKMLDETVKRIAKFPNPVALVNNMYGCHPDEDGKDNGGGHNG